MFVITIEALESGGCPSRFQFYEDLFTGIFGSVKTLLSTAARQTEDYGKYGMTMFDEGAHRKRREEVFPQDRLRAFEPGRELEAENGES